MGEENNKIDWDKKFREFLENYIADDKKRELLINYFFLVRRMDGKIKPEDFHNLYDEFKDKING
ncbi:MAG: hypothetical protein ACP6IY_18375 [Promethearchaeia archaeon]